MTTNNCCPNPNCCPQPNSCPPVDYRLQHYYPPNFCSIFGGHDVPYYRDIRCVSPRSRQAYLNRNKSGLGSPVGLISSSLSLHSSNIKGTELNTQRFATYLKAFAQIFLTPETAWNTAALDNLLKEGQLLYQNSNVDNNPSIPDENNEPPDLETYNESEGKIKRTFSLGGYDFSIELEKFYMDKTSGVGKEAMPSTPIKRPPAVAPRRMDGGDTSTSPATVNESEGDVEGEEEETPARIYLDMGLEDLKSALKSFFTTGKYCLVTFDNLYLLIWKAKGIFFIFDFYGRNMKNLQTDLENGRAMLICVRTLENVCHIIVNLSSLNENDSLSIREMKVVKLTSPDGRTMTRDYLKRINQYEIINSDYAYLKALLHLTLKRDDPLRNRSALPTGVAALIASKIDHPATWNNRMLDKLMCYGLNICRNYASCMSNKIPLNIDQFPKSLRIGQFTTYHKLTPRRYEGIWKCIPNYTRSDLILSLDKAFEDNENQLLLHIDQQIYAIWRKNTFIYLFDPYRHRVENASGDGSYERSATLRMFRNKDIFYKILNQILLSSNRTVKFSIHRLKIQKIELTKNINETTTSISIGEANEDADIKSLNETICFEEDEVRCRRELEVVSDDEEDELPEGIMEPEPKSESEPDEHLEEEEGGGEDFGEVESDDDDGGSRSRRKKGGGGRKGGKKGKKKRGKREKGGKKKKGGAGGKRKHGGDSDDDDDDDNDSKRRRFNKNRQSKGGRGDREDDGDNEKKRKGKSKGGKDGDDDDGDGDGRDGKGRGKKGGTDSDDDKNRRGKDGSGKDGGKDSSGKDGSGKEGGKDGSGKDGSSKDGGKDGSGKDGSSKDGGKDGSGKDGSGKDGSGKDGSGKDGSGKDGSGKDGSGKDGSDKDGSSKDRSGKDGLGKDGSSKDGSNKDGSRKDGSNKDGSGKDRSGKDGSGKDKDGDDSDEAKRRKKFGDSSTDDNDKSRSDRDKFGMGRDGDEDDDGRYGTDRDKDHSIKRRDISGRGSNSGRDDDGRSRKSGDGSKDGDGKGRDGKGRDGKGRDGKGRDGKDGDDKRGRKDGDDERGKKDGDDKRGSKKYGPDKDGEDDGKGGKQKDAENEKKRREKEEAAKRKKEEDAKRKKREEDAAAKKKREEEEAARKREEEEERRRNEESGLDTDGTCRCNDKPRRFPCANDESYNYHGVPCPRASTPAVCVRPTGSVCSGTGENPFSILCSRPPGHDCYFKGSVLNPNRNPGRLRVARDIAVVGSESGSYDSICKLLRAAFRCADRVLIMTPWGNYVLFRVTNPCAKLYFLYNGCTCNVDSFRRLDLDIGTAGLLYFPTLHKVICYMIKEHQVLNQQKKNQQALIDEICKEFCSL